MSCCQLPGWLLFFVVVVGAFHWCCQLSYHCWSIYCSLLLSCLVAGHCCCWFCLSALFQSCLLSWIVVHWIAIFAGHFCCCYYSFCHAMLMLVVMSFLFVIVISCSSSFLFIIVIHDHYWLNIAANLQAYLASQAKDATTGLIFMNNNIFDDICLTTWSMHQSLKEVFHLASFPPCHFPFYYYILLAFACYFSLVINSSILLALVISFIVAIISKTLSVYQTQATDCVNELKMQAKNCATSKPISHSARLVIQWHYMALDIFANPGAIFILQRTLSGIILCLCL